MCGKAVCGELLRVLPMHPVKSSILVFAALVVVYSSTSCGRIDEPAVQRAIRSAVESHLPEGVSASLHFRGVGEGDSGAFHYGFEALFSSDRPVVFTTAGVRFDLAPGAPVEARLEAVFQRPPGRDQVWHLVSVGPPS